MKFVTPGKEKTLDELSKSTYITKSLPENNKKRQPVTLTSQVDYKFEILTRNNPSDKRNKSSNFVKGMLKPAKTNFDLDTDF